MSAVRDEIVKKKNTLSNYLFAICKAIFWGMVVGIIINAVMWHIEGYQALIKGTEHTYDEQIRSIVLRNKSAAKEYASSVDVMRDSTMWVGSTIAVDAEKIPYFNAVEDHVMTTSTRKFVFMAVEHVFIVLGWTFKVVIAKFLSVFASFWVFIFAALMGAMDGLLARYIRTNEGGRESTFIFHRVSDKVIKVPITIVFLYLSSPLTINPEVIVLIMSLLFFVFFYIATANLKKFL